mgnify:CR=1 FL=1
MPYFLPEKYNFKHNIVYFFYNTLVKIVKTGEETGIFQYSFALKNNKDLEIIENTPNENIIDFLLENEYENEAIELMKRQIFDAVLSDFLNFIHNALLTSEKAQLSVTYALLRKPLKDNLLILEWILADPSDFFKKFISNNSNKIIAIDKISKERKIEIITKAIEKTGKTFLPSDFIYELRYDKSKHYGLEPIWNKANHIVTNSDYYSTEDMNLNFVFTQESGKISQWDFLYQMLPSLLLYSIFVCDTIYKSFSKNESVISQDLSIRLMTAYVLCEYQYRKTEKFPIESPTLICRKCNSNVELDEINLRNIYEIGIYKCHKKHKNNLTQL